MSEESRLIEQQCKQKRRNMVVDPIIKLINQSQNATKKQLDWIPPCCLCTAFVAAADAYKLDNNSNFCSVVCAKCKQQCDACGDDQVKKEALVERVFLQTVAPMIEGKQRQKEEASSFHVIPGHTCCAACSTLIANAYNFTSRTLAAEMWHVCTTCAPKLVQEMRAGFSTKNMQFPFRGKEYTATDEANVGFYLTIVKE